MICPKCNISNDDKYLFCLECGTALPKKNDVSSEPPPTALYTPDKFERTEIIPPDKLPTGQNPPNDLPETVFYTPDNLPKTEQMPPDKIPPTVLHSNPQKTTQQRSSPTESFEAPPTVLHTPDKTSPAIQQSNSQFTAAKQFVPPESVETAVSPGFNLEESEIRPQEKQKSKKGRNIFLVAGIFLLLLLLGGGAAVFFFAQPMQEDKSYILSDKHDTKDNILSFDNGSKTFSMVGADKDGFQRWQITPDSANKDFYRFVNRGVGEGESLEVVDDNFDSSVSLNRSAIDQGQLWAITNVEGDYYRITNQWLGDAKSLTHSKRNYYFLRIKDTSGDDDGQLWKKADTGDGQSFFLVNKQYGEKLALEAYSSGEYQDKLAMTAKQSGYSPDVRWIQKDAGNGFINLTTVRSEQINSGKFLGVNPNKNDRLAMTAPAGSSARNWKIVPVGGDGYFRLINDSLGNGKSLEAVTFAKYDLEMVKSSDENPGQLWQLKRTDK